MEATLKYAEHKLDEAIRQGEPDETIAYWRGYRDCAKALEKDRFTDTTKMVPLTLEQLREKVDEPVYLYIYDTALSSGWEILKAVTKDKIIFRGWNTVYVPISSMGKCFDLYAYPPAHIDREAWVSVDERLPEPNSGAYWVAKKKRNGEWQMKLALFCDYGYAMPVDGKTDVTWRDWDYTKIRNVSHWMPLPEPPKKSG